MHEQIAMEELISRVPGRLDEMGYSTETVTGYRRSFAAMRKFAEYFRLK